MEYIGCTERAKTSPDAAAWGVLLYDDESVVVVSGGALLEEYHSIKLPTVKLIPSELTQARLELERINCDRHADAPLIDRICTLARLAPAPRDARK
jgi:hypothetical protein